MQMMKKLLREKVDAELWKDLRSFSFFSSWEPETLLSLFWTAWLAGDISLSRFSKYEICSFSSSSCLTSFLNSATSSFSFSRSASQGKRNLSQRRSILTRQSNAKCLDKETGTSWNSPFVIFNRRCDCSRRKMHFESLIKFESDLKVERPPEMVGRLPLSSSVTSTASSSVS